MMGIAFSGMGAGVLLMHKITGDHETVKLPDPPMERSFPIVKHPVPAKRTPVLVSVPHYGTQPLPHVTRDDYSEPWFETFAYGFADSSVMEQAIAEPRADISAHAPRIIQIKINPDKIRDVIGPGGKMIRSIIERTGVKIDVEDDGRVNVASTDEAFARCEALRFGAALRRAGIDAAGQRDAERQPHQRVGEPAQQGRGNHSANQSSPCLVGADRRRQLGATDRAAGKISTDVDRPGGDEDPQQHFDAERGMSLFDYVETAFAVGPKQDLVWVLPAAQAALRDRVINEQGEIRRHGKKLAIWQASGTSNVWMLENF